MNAGKVVKPREPVKPLLLCTNSSWIYGSTYSSPSSTISRFSFNLVPDKHGNKMPNLITGCPTKHDRWWIV